MAMPPPAHDRPAELKSRGVRAFGWGLVGSAIKFILAIAVQATLARLLGPAEFGLFALGLVMLGVASFFSDVGLATRLVQRPTVDDRAVGFVLGWNLALSACVALIVYVSADLVAAALKQPGTGSVVQILALVLVINAFSSVSVALLRRKLDYRAIQISEIQGYVLGFGLVGIAMAASRYAAHALVCAFVAQALITAALLYARTRHALRLRLRNEDASAFANFGMSILATNLVNWYVASLDKLLIGRAHSQSDLGLYTTVQNLTSSPANMLYPNLQSIVFSTTARLQDDVRALARTYEVLLATVLGVVFPVFVGVAIVADALVSTVYGSKWDAAGGVAPALTLMAPCILVWGISTPLLWNSDRKLTEVKVQALFAMLTTALVYAVVSQPIAIVAWVICLLAYARTAAIVVAVVRRLAISATTLRVIAYNTTLAIGCVGGIVATCRWLVDRMALPPVAVAVLGILASLLGLLLTLLARPSILPAPVREMLGRPARSLPGPVQGALARLWT